MLLDGEALGYAVDRSLALSQKGSKYAAVDDEVWYLLVKRASAEWRTSKEVEGVTLPKKRNNPLPSFKKVRRPSAQSDTYP